MHKFNIPNETPILPYVWDMKRKQRIDMSKVYIWKARLNIHGIKQHYELNYWDNFAPVVTWTSIRLILILSIIMGWHTKKIDFVLAYNQDPVECKLFMNISKRFDVDGNPSSHELQIISNLYGGNRLIGHGMNF